MSMSVDFKNGIVILGAGNVATHLSIALKKAEFPIKCIYSRTQESAKELAIKLNAEYTNQINQVPKDADLYIVSIKDEFIEDIVNQLNIGNGIIVHTAGSISVNVFENKFNKYGVIYPLQTFSKSREVDFSNVPVCIEANNISTENKLSFISSSLSKSVYIVESDKRKILHLAAVFACNFANHMYAVANDLVDQSSLSFDLLKPLILETAQKAINSEPVKVQTGPAIRKDKNIIQMHLEMLQDSVEFKKIYRFVSDSIFELNQKREKK